MYSYYSRTSKQVFHSEHEKENRFLQGNCFETCEYRACSGAKGRVKKLGQDVGICLKACAWLLSTCKIVGKVLNIVGLCGMVVCGV